MSQEQSAVSDSNDSRVLVSEMPGATLPVMAADVQRGLGCSHVESASSEALDSWSSGDKYSLIVELGRAGARQQHWFLA